MTDGHAPRRITFIKGKPLSLRNQLFFVAFRKKDHDCQNKLPLHWYNVLGIIIQEEGKQDLVFAFAFVQRKVFALDLDFIFIYINALLSDLVFLFCNQ